MFLWRRLTLVCVALCLFAPSSVSYKILLVPLSQGSHVSCFIAMARELAMRQHETHVLIDEEYKIDKDVSAVAEKLNITFVRPLLKRDTTAAEEQKDISESVGQLMINNKPTHGALMDTAAKYVADHSRRLLLENEPLIEKLKSSNYDLAVIDGIFCTKHFFLLVHRLGIPWITYTDYPEPWVIKVPWLPSIVPGKFSFESGKMSFLGRISNAWLSIKARLKERDITVPDEITKQYQQYGKFDSPEELMERSGFWILTSNAILDYPKPIMPHMVEVGGLTTQPAKKLPEDIQRFLDGAEDGVILVTFGTMMSSYPDKLLRTFLEAFSQIERHRVMWRLTDASAEFRFPDFIRTYRWLPQNDILAHPKVKLFINHCGNNGQFEALYHGVPMIGFPFIGDQSYNSIRMQSKGFGIAMSVQNLNADELHANIMKILNDPSYKRRISLASEIFRSAPQRPAEKAAYWIEHVIKFGSDHFQSAGKNLNLLQFIMLDIVAMFFVVAVLSLILVKKLISWATKKLFYNSSKRKTA